MADHAVTAVIPLAFVAIIVLFFPFRYTFEFDPDEGVNAIKSFLFLRGYHLYSDIWSDQPPVFTALLAAWFRLFGETAIMGRLMVLAFSAGLLAVASSYLQRSWGVLAAVIVLALVVLLPYYPQLSVSIMIGLPSIAMALGSFYSLERWHSGRQLGWLVLSALLLGLSILTKLFTVVLVPLWLAGILIDIVRTRPSTPGGLRSWIPAAVWVGTLAAMAVAGLWAIGPKNLGQVLDVHLVSAARDLPAWSQMPGAWAFLQPSVSVLLLAAVGVWRGLRAGSRGVLYLAGWIVLGGVFLFLNHPAWYHHQLLITIPAAVLAAIAMATAARDLLRWRRQPPVASDLVASLLTLALLLVLLNQRLPSARETFNLARPNFSPPQAADEERQILALMWNHAAETDWVFTDRPMFAFSIGRPVPPNLAAITEKRLVAGGLTDSEILSTLEAYSPTLILEGQFAIPAVREYMHPRNFIRLDSAPLYRLYLRPRAE